MEPVKAIVSPANGPSGFPERRGGACASELIGWLTRMAQSLRGTPVASMARQMTIPAAAEAHAGQLDKAGEPYILHPIPVMLRMSTEEERIVAVLHDVFEDSPWTTEDLTAEGYFAKGNANPSRIRMPELRLGGTCASTWAFFWQLDPVP